MPQPLLRIFDRLHGGSRSRSIQVTVTQNKCPLFGYGSVDFGHFYRRFFIERLTLRVALHVNITQAKLAMSQLQQALCARQCHRFYAQQVHLECKTLYAQTLPE